MLYPVTTQNDDFLKRGFIGFEDCIAHLKIELFPSLSVFPYSVSAVTMELKMHDSIRFSAVFFSLLPKNQQRTEQILSAHIENLIFTSKPLKILFDIAFA